jgi:hypothetical protein
MGHSEMLADAACGQGVVPQDLALEVTARALMESSSAAAGRTDRTRVMPTVLIARSSVAILDLAPKKAELASRRNLAASA